MTSRRRDAPAAVLEPAPAESPPPRHSLVLGVTADESLRLLQDFPQHLSSRGWDVTVVSSPGRLSSTAFADTEVRFHGIEMTRSVAPARDLVSLCRWISALRRLRPDVLCVSTPKAGLLGGIAGAVTGVPHRVYMLRGLRAEGVRWPANLVLYALERLAVSLSHHVLCVSNSLREAAIDARVVSRSKSIVLGPGSSNGVSTSIQATTPEVREQVASHYFERPGDFTLGYVGRINQAKGLDTLAAALAQLSARGVRGNCLVIGGDDSSRSRILRAALDDTGWTVHQTGHMSDPVSAMRALDVLALPSRREGFPNVVLEAAMLGIPTIGSDATGVRDAVEHGVTGLAVPTGDAEALAGAVELLLQQVAIRRRLGAAARERAAGRFARDIVWEAQAMFLDELLSASVHRP